MRTTYLIDGYNLIHALGLVHKRVVPGELEGARHFLISFLQRHLAKLHAELIVVFDAKRQPRRAAADVMLGDIRVLYASGREADDLLEELIAAHPHPTNLSVVSDDHRLQHAAQRGQAHPLGCQAFLDRIEQEGEASTQPVQRDPAAPAPVPDLAFWLEEFKDVEIPEELRDDFGADGAEE